VKDEKINSYPPWHLLLDSGVVSWTKANPHIVYHLSLSIAASTPTVRPCSST
jgi:hypothetical protein